MNLFNNSIVKTAFVLVGTFLLTWILASYVFYNHQAKIRPKFKVKTESLIGPILGYSGKPITAEELEEMTK